MWGRIKCSQGFGHNEAWIDSDYLLPSQNSSKLIFCNTECPLYEICHVLLNVVYMQGYDLRVEHTHCFSNHGEGGHYHYDTTPDEVEYHGYYTLLEKLYRIDRPTNTHNFGRD